MNFDLMSNLIFVILFLALGIGALVGAIFFDATWHYWTALMCFVLVWTLLTDRYLKSDSLLSYFKRVLDQKKN